MNRSRRILLVSVFVLTLVSVTRAQDMALRRAIADSSEMETLMCNYTLKPAGGTDEFTVVAQESRQVASFKEDDSMLVRNWIIVGFLSTTFAIGLAVIVATVFQNQRTSPRVNSIFQTS